MINTILNKLSFNKDTFPFGKQLSNTVPIPSVKILRETLSFSVREAKEMARTVSIHLGKNTHLALGFIVLTIIGISFTIMLKRELKKIPNLKDALTISKNSLEEANKKISEMDSKQKKLEQDLISTDLKLQEEKVKSLKLNNAANQNLLEKNANIDILNQQLKDKTNLIQHLKSVIPSTSAAKTKLDYLLAVKCDELHHPEIKMEIKEFSKKVQKGLDATKMREKIENEFENQSFKINEMEYKNTADLFKTLEETDCYELLLSLCMQESLLELMKEVQNLYKNQGINVVCQLQSDPKSKNTFVTITTTKDDVGFSSKTKFEIIDKNNSKQLATFEGFVTVNLKKGNTATISWTRPNLTEVT